MKRSPRLLCLTRGASTTGSMVSMVSLEPTSPGSTRCYGRGRGGPSERWLWLLWRPPGGAVRGDRCRLGRGLRVTRPIGNVGRGGCLIGNLINVQHAQLLFFFYNLYLSCRLFNFKLDGVDKALADRGKPGFLNGS